MNESKKRDPRMWEVWKKSGAVRTYEQGQLVTSKTATNIEGRQYSVRPESIDTGKFFYDAFDNSETEISARHIVRMLQSKGQGWTPFKYEDIEAFYQANTGYNGFSFNRLVEPQTVYGTQSSHLAGGGWILQRKDGSYEVTKDFVNRVYRSAPKIKPE